MDKAVILINALPPDASPDELDVLSQAAFIEDALQTLGYDTTRVFMDLDMKDTARQLEKIGPALVFNLVEAVDSSGKLIHLAPALLEHLGIPFTGSPLEAMYVTSNKMLSKSLMAQAGLPTPAWFEKPDPGKVVKGARYIAKPVWEDASVGISDSSVIDGGYDHVSEFIRDNRQHRYFFEEYIEGREFNIAILGGDTGPEVLPLAEIVFEGYPEGKPRIVGYEAKWHEGSFEYDHTLRKFGLEKEQGDLAGNMTALCHRCWELFGMKGYARVDFRVDGSGNPWILEVNANPCLSADAGFFAAASQAGYPFSEVVKRIIEDAWR